MTFPRLESLEELDGAKVLLRLDLNVPLKNGEVMDDTRIQAALPTLQWLLDRVPVIAMCSHLGKPKGSPDPALSLAPVAPAISAMTGKPVHFVEACTGDAVGEALGGENGALVLLENLRFDPGEKANDPTFANSLAEHFSHYVNDAFGTAHRAHASVAGIPALFATGRKAAGRLMESELENLGRLRDDPQRPYMALIGGAKISTKTAPLEALLEQVDFLAIGGGMANTFFLARGYELGASLVEAEMVETARAVLRRAEARGVEILQPIDLVIADRIDQPRDIRTVPPTEIPAGYAAVDIGPATRMLFSERLKRCRSAFWNGPMGIFENKEFAAGTLSLAHALADCGAFTVVGGGESVMAVHQAGVGDSIDHVSTGGGASLSLIAGDPLPAVQALEES